MTTITLETLRTVLGIPGTTPVDGKLSATPWIGDAPAARVVGPDVVVPDPITVRIVDGVPEAPIELVPLEGMAWRLWVGTWRPRHNLTRFVTVPSSGSVEFADLVDVNPFSFDPEATPEASWWAEVAALNQALQSGELNGEPGAPGAPGASAYQVAVAGGFVGTEAEWLASLEGDPGADGTNGSNGADGADGREIQLQTNATHIQWRYAGDAGWTDLLPLTAITGPAGADGTDGTNGADGAAGDDGREVEFQKTATHIQWRYVGDPGWTNLVALADITGPAGADGAGGGGAVPGMVGDQTMSRTDVTSSVTSTTQRLVLGYLTAGSDDTITALRMVSGGTATAAGATVNRLGLYRVESNGDLTLVGSTAHDANIGTVANTAYDVPLSAPVARVEGQRYAIGRLVVSAGAVGTIAGASMSSTAITLLDPRMSAVVNSQTDLPASVANASLVAATNLPYFEALP